MGWHMTPKVLLLDRSRTANATLAVSDTIRNDLPIHPPSVAHPARRPSGPTPAVSRAHVLGACHMSLVTLRFQIPKNSEGSDNGRSIPCYSGAIPSLFVPIPAVCG